jgi:hypothetical protein
MLSSVFGISSGAASSESSEEALLKKQAEEMEEVHFALHPILSFRSLDLIICTIYFILF